MEQPHRARQFDLVGLDQDDLALDAAKLRLRIARGKAAAIDHDAVDVVRLRLAVEFDLAAGSRDARVQFRQNPPWLDMAFAGVKKSLAETALKRGLDLAQAVRVEPSI